MKAQSLNPGKRTSSSGQKLLAQRLTVEELKTLKGGSGREHDLVAPADGYGVGIYSDGDRPPKPTSGG